MNFSILEEKNVKKSRFFHRIFKYFQRSDDKTEKSLLKTVSNFPFKGIFFFPFIKTQ